MPVCLLSSSYAMELVKGLDPKSYEEPAEGAGVV